MKRVKKTLSWLLSFALLLSCIYIPTFAAGDPAFTLSIYGIDGKGGAGGPTNEAIDADTVLNPGDFFEVRVGTTVDELNAFTVLVKCSSAVEFQSTYSYKITKPIKLTIFSGGWSKADTIEDTNDATWQAFSPEALQKGVKIAGAYSNSTTPNLSTAGSDTLVRLVYKVKDEAESAPASALIWLEEEENTQIAHSVGGESIAYENCDYSAKIIRAIGGNNLPTLNEVSLASDQAYVDGEKVYVYDGETVGDEIAAKTFQASATSAGGNDITGKVTWSVSPTGKGVTISEAGLITVSETAEACSYTVKAAPKSGETQGDEAGKTAAFTVTREASALAGITVSSNDTELANGASVTVNGTDTTTALTVSGLDQFGAAYEAFSVAAATGENYATAQASWVDGKTVTIPGNTANNTPLKITATDNNDATATAERTLTITRNTQLAANAMTLTGAEQITIDLANGSSETYTAALTDQFGDSFNAQATDFTWSLSGVDTANAGKITLSDGGVLTVDKTAAADEVTVTATYQSNTALTKSVNVSVISLSFPTNITVTTKEAPTYGDTWNDIVTSITSDGIAYTAKLGEADVAGKIFLADASETPNAGSQTAAFYFTATDDSAYQNIPIPALIVSGADVTIAKASFTPTVTLDGWTYGETAKTPSVFGNTSNGGVTYQYKAKDADDATYGDGVPTAAGSYTVRATVEGTDNYNSATATADFTIAKRALALTWPTVVTFTYGDDYDVTAVSDALTSDTVVLAYTYAGREGTTYGSTATAPTAVGKYTVTAALDAVAEANANYVINGGSTCDFEIAKATPTVTAPTAKTGLTYDGTAQALIDAGSTTGGTLQYSLDNSAYGTDIPTGTNAGYYRVWYKVVGDANYNDVAAEKIDSITIAKASITPTVTLENWVFGTTASTPSVTGNTGEGAVTYAYKVKGAADSDYSTTVPTSVGEYTVRATIAETTNYNGASATAEFQITKTLATLTTAPTATNPTYNRTAQALVDASNAAFAGGTLNYALGSDGENAPGTGWSATVPTGTNAGTYYVWCKVSGDNDHDDSAAQCVTSTIAKATVTAAIATVTAKTYDGTTEGVGTLSLSGVQSGDTVTASGTFTWAAATAGTKNIGVTGIVLDGADKDNYVLSATTIAAAAPGNMEIAKKQVTLTWSDNTTLTYNGNEQTYAGAAAVGAVSGETLGVVYDSTNKATQTNAGNYTAEVTALSGETKDNYEFASDAVKIQAWTIARKTITPTVTLSKTEDEYSGADQKNDISVIVKVDGNDLSTDEYQLAWSKDGAPVAAIVNYGAYTVTITDKTGGNYQVNSATATYTVTKKLVIVSGITAADKTYDGTRDATLNLDSVVFKAKDNSTVLNDSVLAVTATGTFADENVGSKTVAISDLALTTDAAASYTLASSNQQTSTTANITAREITVSGITAADKTYDGAAAATVDAANATLTGKLASDDLSVNVGDSTFADANAGNNKTVTLGQLTLTGSDAGNYVLKSGDGVQQAEAIATITPLPVTVKWFAGETSTEYQSAMPFVDGDYALPTPKAFAADGSAIGTELVALERTALTKDGNSTDKVNAVGAYAATAGVTSSFTAGNYTFTDANLSFSVEKANVTITWKVDGEAINTTGYAFDLANGHTISFDVACPGVSDSGILDKLKANFVIGELKLGEEAASELTGSTAISKKVNTVGAYTATIGAATGKSLDNFKITGNTATFTINPMELDVRWVVKKGADTATAVNGGYPFLDGNPYTVTAIAVQKGTSTEVSAVTLTVKKGDDTAAASATVADVADYAFTVGALTPVDTSNDSANNYRLPTDMGATTIRITPATPTITWKVDGDEKTGSTYTGEAQTVSAVIMNGSTDVTSKFNITPGAENYTTALTNAGTYTFSVVAKADADKTNYTLPTNATQEFAIAKATRTLTATAPAVIKGVGGTGDVTLALGADDDKDNSAATCDLTVAASPSGIVTLPETGKFATAYTVTSAGVGETTLTFTLAASDNYEAATATAKVKVDAGYKVKIGEVTGGSVKTDVAAAAEGTVITLTLTPANGYQVPAASAITGVTATAKAGTTNQFTFTLGATDVTVGVTFEKLAFAVTASGTLPTGVSLTVPSGNVDYGATATVTVSGDNAANVTRVFWYKTGETPSDTNTYDLKTGESNYTFTMPGYAVTVGAEAATPVTLAVTASDEADGALSTDPAAGSVLPGTIVTVTATPVSGKTNGGVTVTKTGDTATTVPVVPLKDSNGAVIANKYTFTAPDFDVTVSASFIATANTSAAASNDENKVTAEKTAGETEVATAAALESKVDAETLKDIETAAAKVDVTNDTAVENDADDPDASTDKATAVQKLAETGMVQLKEESSKQVVKTEDGAENATIRIVNKVFMDVEVKDFTDNGENMSMTLDIKPMQQKVATVEAAGTQLTDENSVPIETKQPLTVTAAVNLTIGIPQAMADKALEENGQKYVFVKHTHSNNSVYIYKAFLNGLLASFVNPNGFSEFEVTLQDSSVASYAYSNTETRYFETFKAAVEEAITNGKTAITLHKNPDASDKATISEPVELQFSKASGAVTTTYSDLYADNFTWDGASAPNPALAQGSTSSNVNNGLLKFAWKHNVAITGASSVTKDGTITLTAAVTDAEGSPESVAVTWVSSDETKATVVDGVVTGVATGSVTITAKYTDTADSNRAYTGTKTITVQSGGGSISSGGAVAASTVTTASGVKNGTVKYSSTSAKAGDKVTVTATPDKGYKLASITVKDGKGNTVAVTANADGTYSFTMPNGAVTVTPVFEKASAASQFVDIPANAYYADAVAWAVEKGITKGTSDTTFSPDDACTRAQAVTFLYRAAGEPAVTVSGTFADVEAGSYYEKAVAWAVANGITNGTGDTTFSPDTVCTRAQIVTFLQRYEKAAAANSGRFSDVDANAYYAGAVGWAVANGITNGTGDTTFSPETTCTRAQIVTFLYRDFVK